MLAKYCVEVVGRIGEADTMSSTPTVRDIDSGDTSWLKCEARRVAVSMEEFVRRIMEAV